MEMGTPAEMDIGGQAPQTDGHGSQALTGLPPTKTGRWGLLWNKEGLCRYPLSGSPSHASPPSAVRLKKKKVVVVKGRVEM